MPYKQKIKDKRFSSHFSSGGETDTFWTLQDNVGYGYKNRWLDVMLVQFFLNKVARSKILEPDGLFGGKTWRAIKDYQTRWNCVADGMVTAAQGDSLISKKQGRVFTICYLNVDYFVLHRAYYDDLKKDPDLPSALCNHFTIDFDFNEN